MKFKTYNFTLENRAFRRTDCFNEEGNQIASYFERFVPETSVYRGLDKWEDRHACWRMVPASHHKLRAKLGAVTF